MTHTPGPWKLSTVPTSCGSCHQIGPFPGSLRDGIGFACIYADDIRIGIDERLPRAQELLANARLIAAAPDLLAALKEIANGEGYYGAQAAEYKAIARAAIAKAEAA